MTDTYLPEDTGLSKVQSNPTIETTRFRSISSDIDTVNEIGHYYLVCKAKELSKLSTDRNLRDYMGQEGSTRKKTAVHSQIEDSMKHNSELFKILHSGCVVVAEAAKEHKSRTLINLENAQLINGAQSRGVLLDLMAQEEKDGSANSPYHNALISIEIIVTKDWELRNDICNARNFQTAVQFQSILEQQDVFEDLNRSMFAFNKEWEVSGRETSQTDIPVAKLIQISRLFLPNEVFEGNVKKAYVGATSCLRDYQKWYLGRHSEYKEIYNFIVACAPLAWNQYLHWNSHKGWKGNFLRDDEDNKNKTIGDRLPDGNWTNIKNGILFPMLRSLHSFVEWDGKNVSIDTKGLDETGLIKAAIKLLRERFKNNPQSMGKDDSAYDKLTLFAMNIDIRT